MTRRDYLFLAESFRLTLAGDALTPEAKRGAVAAATDLALKIAADNRAFDKELFLQNAGVYGNEA